MKRPVLVAATLTAAAILIGAFVLALRPGSPNAPALVLPAADRFAPGPCRDAAEAVRSLARLTHGGVTALTPADRAELRRVQDQLGALRTTAAANVREPMEAVILTVGYLRLRLDSRTAVPQYLSDVEEARARLEHVCVDEGDIATSPSLK